LVSQFHVNNIVAELVVAALKWLNAIAFHRKAISELRSVTRHMGSPSVSCHPTQVNAPYLNPSQIGWYSIYLSRKDGRLT